MIEHRGLPSHIDQVVARVGEKIRDQVGVRPSWLDSTDNNLYYELVACILGSNVSFELSVMAAEYLNQLGLLAPMGIRDFDEYEYHLYRALRAIPVQLNGRNCFKAYRFPQSRATILRKTAEKVSKFGVSLYNLLSASLPSKEVRNSLVSTIPGIGPKQASLYLRNVGYAVDLAILDSHVLRFMRYRGLLPTNDAKVNTLTQYENVEQALRNYAQRLGLLLSDLDLAIWVTMRVLRRRDYFEYSDSGIWGHGLDPNGFVGA